MKKIGKKLSYFTKVLLVLSLMFSNLSGLSVVFAYEAADNFDVLINENNELVIDYLKELDETDVVKIEISESYTYLEGVASEKKEPVSYEVLGSELLVDTGVKFASSILSTVLFDGLYESNVSLYNITDDMDLGTVLVSENIVHDSGLKVKLYDSTNNEIMASGEGKYNVSSDNNEVYVTMQVLAGGLKPTDVFNYEGIDYVAKDMLLETITIPQISFEGRLFGEYTEEASVSLKLNDEDIVMSQELTIMYGTYEENTNVLNTELVNLGLDDMYGFSGETQEGELYVLLQDEKRATLFDLYNVLVNAIGENEKISFVISNKDYEDVLKAYEELSIVTLEDDSETVTLDNFLKEILVTDDTVLTLVSEDLTITYTATVVADLNNDSLLTQEDLLLMIDQIVGIDEVTLDKSDIYGDDDTLSVVDVMYLAQVIKNKSWNTELISTELESIDTRLDVVESDIVSGDNVTVNYVLTIDEYEVNGISGTINYDETMLELVSVTADDKFIGNNNEGKFLYLTEESLTGNTMIVDEQEVVEPVEYVVLTATFKALKSGVSTVEIEEPEYFNQEEYYKVDNTVSTLVIVNESNDNNLATLIVSGQTIELIEDVLEYQITVSNDIVSSLVEAITSNIAASVSSIVAPEELAEGENTITIVVTAENGDEKVYTITVVRESAPKKEESTGTSLNYTDDVEEDNTIIEDDTIGLGDSDEDDEDDDVVEENNDEGNLSRIIILILILLVIAGLIYLIFKDDNEDEESKKVNKEINKMKKDKEFTTEKKNEKIDTGNKKNKNKKKGR